MSQEYCPYHPGQDSTNGCASCRCRECGEPELNHSLDACMGRQIEQLTAALMPFAEHAGVFPDSSSGESDAHAMFYASPESHPLKVGAFREAARLLCKKQSTRVTIWYDQNGAQIGKPWKVQRGDTTPYLAARVEIRGCCYTVFRPDEAPNGVLVAEENAVVIEEGVGT